MRKRRSNEVCFWLVTSLAFMQPLACRQAENSSTIQDIAVGKKEPKASSGDLSEWVERCRSRGISIELIELENHKRIVPTKGSDGVQCTVTSVESLLDGRSSLAKAQEVYLYPFTTSDRVIVLQHPDGNWVDAEERARQKPKGHYLFDKNQRDTTYLKKPKGHYLFVDGPLFIGRFRSTGFLNTWKSRPEFENQVPN